MLCETSDKLAIPHSFQQAGQTLPLVHILAKTVSLLDPLLDIPQFSPKCVIYTFLGI